MESWKFFVFLLSAKLIFPNENPFGKFHQFLKSKENCILNLEIYQKQFDKIHKSFGSLQLVSQDHYIFDDQNQRIIYEGKTIKTINKNSRQIIYDSNINNDFSILDVLTGKNVDIELKDHNIEDGVSKTSFFIANISMLGVLWTKIDTGEIKKIKLIADEDLEIEINILSSNFNINDSLASIDTLGYEIINLREQTF